ncbi:IucC family-domain-containing protein [Lentinula lateritia]|uniref:IucC family-domain-containing protein n=1 Tax=Lentinula aff. lateritia TaxID=2804960 RepID=A0ACC1TK64_9AGAR|nr:IucC family-domain-containing protein [Lentinula aff. lateritia]KAJ3846920.1 IucC family-domain-containing protein [Lentinula lateritia]
MDPFTKAQFATSSRLVSCLVTESLSRALYYKFPLPTPPSPGGMTGFCVLLSGTLSSQPPRPLNEPYILSSDVLAIVLLAHVPVFKHDGTDLRGQEIGLLDPMDMIRVAPLKVQADSGEAEGGVADSLSKSILSTLSSSSGWQFPTEQITLISSPDPLVLWRDFASGFAGVEQSTIIDIAEELRSSVEWQQHSYLHPPIAPTFPSSSSIEWEQSITEGHPTHPMHKTRMFLPPMRDITDDDTYDLYNPQLRFIALPKSSLHITYDFEELTEPLRRCAAEAAAAAASDQVQEFLTPTGDMSIPPSHFVIPIHELQIPHIEEKFPEALIYPEQFKLPLQAQQSIRSVILPSFSPPSQLSFSSPSSPSVPLSLKLSVGIKLTSAIRTISPASAFLGPRFSKHVIPRITSAIDPSILTVAKELASVVSTHPDPEIAKFCAAIVREAHDVEYEANVGERLIVCTALVETGHSSSSDPALLRILRILPLPTKQTKLTFLTTYTTLLFRAFLPPAIHHGVAFEAHPQNCLARFDVATGDLLGFVIRDFGGIRVHEATLLSSLSPSSDSGDPDDKLTRFESEIALAGHSILAPSLEEVYTRLYHTLIHNHLQQLIRVLELHYDGTGWEVVRGCFGEVVGREEREGRGRVLWEAWMGSDKENRETVEGKCFMRMRMQGMYRFHLHGPFPNLLHYRGVGVEDDVTDSNDTNEEGQEESWEDLREEEEEEEDWIGGVC